MLRSAAVAALSCVLVAGGALAQTSYPTKDVKIIVPYAAGGPADVMTRFLAEKLSKKWGRPVIVENKPGGGTLIGLNAVAKAPADGYTLGYFAPSFMVNAALKEGMSYDTIKDLLPISIIALNPMVVVANKSFPASTLAELKSYSDQHLNDPPAYATSGVGGIPHMAMELLQREANFKLTHVPYSGSAKAILDVAGGHIPMAMDVWVSVRPLYQGGGLKLLATTTAARLQELPNVPTVAETFPGFEAYSFAGYLVPAATPSAVVSKIVSSINEVVETEEFRLFNVSRGGVEAPSRSPEQIKAYVETEISKWRKIGNDAKIKLE